MEPGRQQRRQERLTLMFDGEGRLTGLQGDYMPGLSRDQAILGESSTQPAATQEDLIDDSL